MDSKEPSTTPANPSKPSTSATASATAAPPTSPRTSAQEQPTTLFFDRATSAHAFDVPFSPYIRGSQVGDRTPNPLMMPPYGNPIPYPSPYPHGGVYPHPSLAAAGSVYIAADSENRPNSAGIERGPAKKPDVVSWNSRKSGNLTSSSGNEDGLQSNDHESEGSSEEGNGSASSQESYDTPLAHLGFSVARMKHSGKTYRDALWRAVLHGPATKLNIGMDQWNAPHAGMRYRPNALNIASDVSSSSMFGWQGLVPKHLRMQQEREREALARSVAELRRENSALKIELKQLNKFRRELELENASLKEDLTPLYGIHEPSELEGKNGDSSVD